MHVTKNMKSPKINVIPIIGITFIFFITFRPLSALSPSFSVISEADMALGRSCLFANTNKMASLSSSSSNYQRYEKSLSNTIYQETYNRLETKVFYFCKQILCFSWKYNDKYKHSFHQSKCKISYSL